MTNGEFHVGLNDVRDGLNERFKAKRSALRPSVPRVAIVQSDPALVPCRLGGLVAAAAMGHSESKALYRIALTAYP